MSLRVLIVEDEWLLSAALRCQIEAHGHEVVGIAGTGREALAACAQHLPDVVLMDVQMPELDGLSATRQLMVSDPCAVVIITGNGAAKAAAAEAGAMVCVIKPLVSHHLPRVLDEARSRFARFACVRAEEGDCAAALGAWRLVCQAVCSLAEDGRSEEQAFAHLLSLASATGHTLRAQAERLVQGTLSP